MEDDKLKGMKEAFEKGIISQGAKTVAMPASAVAAQHRIGPHSMIPVDTTLPTRDFLNDLKKCLQDNMGILESDLKRLSDEYEARESELNRIIQQVDELETCIKSLDNE